MQHALYVPASYAAVIYAVVTGGALLLCLFVGLAKHGRDILMTACGPDHYEFWPSISTTIGDFMPERQLWRLAFIFCAPFRVGCCISTFVTLWQHACGGMAELRGVAHAPWQLLRSSSMLVLAAFVVDVARMLAAMTWTMVASFESLPYHNLGFGPYIFFCFCMQALLNVVVQRNRYNLRLYPSHQAAAQSLRCKRVFFWTETATALGVVGFYVRHYVTCAPASFSLSTMNEWVFAACNIAYDWSLCYELSSVGWWFCTSPTLHARAQQQMRALLRRGCHTALPVHSRVTSPPTLTTTTTTAALLSPPPVQQTAVPLPPRHDNNGDDVAAAMLPSSSSMTTATAVQQQQQQHSHHHGSDGVVGVNTASGAAVERASSRHTLINGDDDNDNDGDGNDGALTSDAATTTTATAVARAAALLCASSPAGVDTVVHTLTFFCAPHAWTMWVCDVYWLYILYEMAVQVIQHMYFMPLVLMSLSWEIGLVVVTFAAPCVLRVRVLRRWLTGPCLLARRIVPVYAMSSSSYNNNNGEAGGTSCEAPALSHDAAAAAAAKTTATPWLTHGHAYRLPPMYVLLYAVAAMSHLQMLVTRQPHRKLHAATVGPVAVLLATFLRMLYPCSGDSSAAASACGHHAVSPVWLDVSSCRRRIYAVPLAFVVCMLLRILHISHSPLLVEAFYTGVVGILGGLVCTTLVYREAVCAHDASTASNNDNNNSDSSDKVLCSNGVTFVNGSDTTPSLDARGAGGSGGYSSSNNTMSNRHVVAQPPPTSFGVRRTGYGDNNSSNTANRTHYRNASADANDAAATAAAVVADADATTAAAAEQMHEVDGGVAVGVKAYAQATSSPLLSSTSPAAALASMTTSAAAAGGGGGVYSHNSIAALALANGGNASLSQPPTWLLGMLFGLLLSLFINLYVSANYLPRMLAIAPYPASLLVVAAFVAGLYSAPDVIAIAPHLMRARTRRARASSSLSSSSRLARLCRVPLPLTPRWFGAALLLSSVVLLYGTRQTNFTYETRHAHYPTTPTSTKEHVNIDAWRVQADMAGSRWLAFAGGLCMTFLLTALAPVVTEVTLAHLYCRRRARQHAAAVAAAASAAATTSTGASGSPSSTTTREVDAAVYACEGGLLTSFELMFALTTIGPCLLYALCTSYPFVPLGWLVRERSRPLLLLHILTLYMGTLAATRSLRVMRGNNNSSNNNAAAVTTSTVEARRQRSLSVMALLCLALLFAAVVVGRAAFAPGEVSYPAGLDTVPRYAREVMQVHDRLVQLYRERNGVTDGNLAEHERERLRNDYHNRHFDLERAVHAYGPDDVQKQLAPWAASLDEAAREAVWQAANAMTFLTGMIWTVHFGLDNHNVDSFERMVQQIGRTGANVVGLLESDTMHLVNGMRDMVEYVAYYLGFRYTDYGPTALDNTYGCALLSRFPIVRVRRYVAPSPLGELSCIIHAILDVYGLHVHTYVGHFGNTEHWADGLLQSQFLGQLVQHNPGPSLWLGYLVTYPGNAERYGYYSDPHARGKLRDAALELYVRRPWVRLYERGGYDEPPPPSPPPSPPGAAVDFDVEYKLPRVRHLEGNMTVDASFRRTPPGEAWRTFYLNSTNRYTPNHPRFEFVDRYCQYCLYKTGDPRDEDAAVAPPPHALAALRQQLQTHAAPQVAPSLQQSPLPPLPSSLPPPPSSSASSLLASSTRSWLQPCTMDVFDWWRVIDDSLNELSDTEIQVIQMRFRLLDALRDDHASAGQGAA